MSTLSGLQILDRARSVSLRRPAGWILLAALAIPCAALPAIAQEDPESKKLDLTVHYPDDPELWLRPSLRFDTVWFTGANAWGGDTRANIGNTSNGWAEFGLVPALDGHASLGEYGTLTAKVSGVYTTTQLGLDWGGSNFWNGQTHKPQDFTLEEAWAKWTSGELVPSLGTDALEFSLGSQNYQVGPELGKGFIFYNAGSDGGRKGGYWLGLRNAFELAAIGRIHTGDFSGETLYFRSNDTGGDHTQGTGANVDYDFSKLADIPRLKAGVGYWYLFQSDDRRRDGLNVWDVRFETAPFSSLPGLGFTGEIVAERNESKNRSWAAWGESGYDFGEDDVAWAPYLSFRYVYFSGDGQSGKHDNAFDPLFYGFSDWNYWYIGEISGEWVTGNSDFQASIVRLRANPVESVTLQLFYIYQRLNEKVNNVLPPGGHDIARGPAAIKDKDLSHEVDFIADWAVNDYLSTSFVAAFLVPLSGGKQFFGNDEVWTQFMFYTSLRF